LAVIILAIAAFLAWYFVTKPSTKLNFGSVIETVPHVTRVAAYTPAPLPQGLTAVEAIAAGTR
jgi:hypothetical protein